MPTLSDLYGLNDPEPTAPTRPAGSEFGRGFKKSFAEVPGMAAGVAAFGADVVGADGMRDSLLGYAGRKQQQVEQDYGSEAASFSNVIEGKADPLDFLANASGYVIGQAAQAIATGGLTALGFKAMAKGAAMQAAKLATEKAAAAGVAEEAARQIGLDAARTVLTKSAITGATAGAGTQNLNMELGSIYPEAVDEAKAQGRELDSGDKLRVGLSALAAAAVDTAMERVTAGRFLKGTDGGSIMSRARREVPMGMARESVTEGIQTGIEHYGAGKPIADEAGVRDIVDSMAVGAVGGGLAGGAGSLQRRATPEDGLRELGTATNVDEAIAAFTKATDVPLAGISAEQEGAAMGAMERQAKADQDQIKLTGRLMPMDQQRRPDAPAAPAVDAQATVTDSPYLDRLLTLQEQVADPAVREQVRKAFGPDALREVLRAMSVADRPDINMPEVTRDRVLAAAETIVSRAIAQPLPGAAPSPSARRVSAGPELAAPAPVPRIGLDTAQTGTIRVDGTGSAAPETRADAISTKQRVDAMRVRPDGMTQEVPGRPLPRDFELVGEGTLTTPERPARAAPLAIALDTPLEQRAHEAATSPTNERPEPTQAQKEAGNYRLGHVRIAGLDISVENPAGSTRKGVDADGKAWESTLAHHYGYIKGSLGADGDHVDAFIKPGTPQDYAGPVFVVDQIDPKTGKFDEHKVVLGAVDRADAEAVYRANYAPDWQGMKSIKGMTMPAFKKWLAGDTTKPIGTLKDRVDAMRTPDAQVSRASQPGGLPTEKLAQLVERTGRSREDVVKQYTGFVEKHGREKADQLLDQALQVAKANPKPAPAPAPNEEAPEQPAVADQPSQPEPAASSPAPAAEPAAPAAPEAAATEQAAEPAPAPAAPPPESAADNGSPDEVATDKSGARALDKSARPAELIALRKRESILKSIKECLR